MHFASNVCHWQQPSAKQTHLKLFGTNADTRWAKSRPMWRNLGKYAVLDVSYCFMHNSVNSSTQNDSVKTIGNFPDLLQLAKGTLLTCDLGENPVNTSQFYEKLQKVENFKNIIFLVQMWPKLTSKNLPQPLVPIAKLVRWWTADQDVQGSNLDWSLRVKTVFFPFFTSSCTAFTNYFSFFVSLNTTLSKFQL